MKLEKGSLAYMVFGKEVDMKGIVEEKELNGILSFMAQGLSDYEEKVVTMRYILGYSEYRVSREFGVNFDGLKELEKKAIERLKVIVNDFNLEDYIVLNKLYHNIGDVHLPTIRVGA